MAHILDRIVATKRDEIAALEARAPLADLKARAEAMPPTRGFQAALRAAPDVALIAEVKKASPSKGVIRADFDPTAIATAYHAAGASCLSVLTDETYFQGQLSYLRLIGEIVPLPLLRKDFVIDPVQIYEARVAGADAVLLIVAILSPAQVAEFGETASSLGLDALVEVHSREELEIAKAAGAGLIGINNRDLKTFDVRLETTEELLPHMPPGALVVAESGIHTRQDVERLAAAGAHAFLVGESLMRADNISAATRKLLGR